MYAWQEEKRSFPLVCTPTHPPTPPPPPLPLAARSCRRRGREGGGERVLCVPQSVCGRGEYTSSVCLGCRKEKRQKECAASAGPSSSSLLEAQQRRRRKRRRRRSFLPPPQERWGGGRKRKGISPALSQFGAAATSAGGAIQLRSREGIKGTLLLFPSNTQ